jgi:hypothetical protein
MHATNVAAALFKIERPHLKGRTMPAWLVAMLIGLFANK